MTRNQIEYWKLQESKRSNLANEGETSRSNKARESETTRHNLVTEGQTNQQLAESQRHNVATEGESFRHNTATEAQAANDLLERVRSNKAQEDIARVRNDISRQQVLETSRSNLANEVIGRANASSNLINSNVKRSQLALDATDVVTRQRQQEESARHNLAQESIEKQKNAATTATSVLSTVGRFLGSAIGRSLSR